MLVIENLKLHYYNNGKVSRYSATLRDENNNSIMHVILNLSGEVFSAYEPETDFVYHLSFNPNIHSIDDLRDGERCELIATIPPVLKQR